jgi:hypothetical protein
MIMSRNKDKKQEVKVVYKNRFSLFFLHGVSWVLMIFFALAGYRLGLCMMGLFTLLISIPLFDPKTKYLFTDTKEYKEHIEKEFEKKFNDHGIFTYTDNGFTVKIDRNLYHVKWSEIESMFGYKLDIYKNGEICLDVFCDDGVSFRLSESKAGWFQFLQKASVNCSNAVKGWEKALALPSFTTNLTLVYDREERTIEQVGKQYYNYFHQEEDSVAG